MQETLLVNISGTDRPGLTNALAEILADFHVRIMDIGQAVIHDHVSLGMLLVIPEGEGSFEFLKQLLYKAHALNLTIRFTPVAEDKYESWVNTQTQERTVFTILGRSLSAGVLEKLTNVLMKQGLNIEKISRLSRRLSLKTEPTEARACFEFSVLGTPKDRKGMSSDLMQITQDEEVDIAVQADDMYRRNRRLVVFDMDSTLIRCEVIDELAKLAGVGEQVAEITERAMRGELDFKSSFRERLALLRGLPYSEVEAFADRLPLMEGATHLISTLKKLGFKTAICSGGFTLFGYKLQKDLGIDYVHANELEVQDGLLTGRVVGEIVDGTRKAELMRQMADELGLARRQTIAVGDGANDLPMIQQAGLGIAFRAKPLVRQNAAHSISVLGLDGILYLIGVRDRDLFRETHLSQGQA